jgi:hypothetical protein
MYLSTYCSIAVWEWSIIHIARMSPFGSELPRMPTVLASYEIQVTAEWKSIAVPPE